MATVSAHLLFALCWLGFGTGHSILASSWVKQHLRPFFGVGCRLAYNFFAILHLAFVGWAGWVLFQPHDAFVYAGWAAWGLKGAFGLGVALFLIALTGYDVGRLLGIRQIQNRLQGIEEPEDEPLRTDGLHRWVRHPLYLGGLMAVWGRVGNEFELATAVWVTLYMGVGAWLEERKLLRLYNAAYADYRRKVPAVIPWKGRVL